MTHYLRRAFLLFLTLTTFTSAYAERPNVLFIAVDDMNDWLGCHHTTPHALTPHMDRLAARGVNFMNAHTAGVYCAPSRSAIFTGQFASTTGCYRTQIYFVNHPDIRPLHLSFSKGGYKTFGTGKLFHHMPGQIDQRGWTEFHVRTQRQRDEGWPLDSWSEETPIPQPYPNSIYNQDGGIKSGFLEWGKVPNEREGEMADTMRTEWVVSKLKETHDKPFFLALGLYTPHFPNYCPAKYFDLYERDQIELPPYKADDLDDLPAKIRKAKTGRSRIHQKLVRLNAVKDAIHGYLACMSYADAMIGRVLETLAESPYADNTIVVLWSDHGYHHGEKYDWGKHTLWERTSNVPFIWAGPGIAKGVTTDVTVSLLDMYPTLVEQCALEQPAHNLEGVSLAQTLADPSSAKDRNVVLPFMQPNTYAIINRDWRYIHYADDTEELYDLQADPNEWYNLALKPEMAERKQQLKLSAPPTFAEPGIKLKHKKDLVIEGEKYHWELPLPGIKRNPIEKIPPVASIGALPPGGGAVADQPNIIVFLVDDYDKPETSVYGGKVLTPNLDRLAREGMTFHNAHVTSTVCTPSRYSFLTGRYAGSSHSSMYRDLFPLGTQGLPAFNVTLESENMNVARVLADNGYATGFVGKWHVGSESDALHEVPKNVEYSKEINRHFFENEKHFRKLIQQRGFTWAKNIYWNNTKAPFKGHNPEWTIAAALEFVEQHKDGPFYLHYCTTLLHGPNGEWHKSLTEKELVSGEGQLKRPVQGMPPRASVMERIREAGLTENEAGYLWMDDGLGLLLDKLDELGIADNTIVVFVSDHGSNKKGSLFKTRGTEIPCLIRWPKVIKAGTETDELIQNTDFVPTWFEAAGAKTPDAYHMDGVSILPLLKDPRRTVRDYVYGEQGPARSIKTKDWTYISLRYTDEQIEALNGPRGERFSKTLLGLSGGISRARYEHPYAFDADQLYRLSDDPEERTNLANESQQRKQLKTMRGYLKQTLKGFVDRPYGEFIPGGNANPGAKSVAVLDKLREHHNSDPGKTRKKRKK